MTRFDPGTLRPRRRSERPGHFPGQLFLHPGRATTGLSCLNPALTRDDLDEILLVLIDDPGHSLTFITGTFIAGIFVAGIHGINLVAMPEISPKFLWFLVLVLLKLIAPIQCVWLRCRGRVQD